MKPTTKIAIAGLLSAAGAVLNALATEFGNSPSGGGGEAPEVSAPAEAPTKPKKAPKAEKPAEKPADPAPAETAAEEPAAAPAEGGKTYEELKAIIAPLVASGEGLQVKAIIKKYDPESTPPSLKTMPAKNHAAFEKDIQALTY